MSSGVWTQLGLNPQHEIHGGHQSRVFLATNDSGPLIVKLVESGPSDGLLCERVEIASQLASSNRAVVGPLETTSGLVVEVDGWLAVRYPYLEGTHPSVDVHDEVKAMAATLALVHSSMAALENPGLPPVMALVGTESEQSHRQMIHGDYASTNLINTDDGLRVIDFDDSGLGTVEFEIGNSLYMVMFDAWHSCEPDRYRRFRPWFVAAYQDGASLHFDDELIDQAIQTRLTALDRWLMDLTTAPIGIRSASSEWQDHLRLFVDQHLTRR